MSHLSRPPSVTASLPAHTGRCLAFSSSGASVQTAGTGELCGRCWRLTAGSWWRNGSQRGCWTRHQAAKEACPKCSIGIGCCRCARREAIPGRPPPVSLCCISTRRRWLGQRRRRAGTPCERRSYPSIAQLPGLRLGRACPNPSRWHGPVVDCRTLDLSPATCASRHPRPSALPKLPSARCSVSGRPRPRPQPDGSGRAGPLSRR
jgi:hypothetical protein